MLIASWYHHLLQQIDVFYLMFKMHSLAVLEEEIKYGNPNISSDISFTLVPSGGECEQ